ncbi:MAG: hypothetical protein ACO2PN_16555 [Pyrobaculum sp.]|jgi:hypothetical protein
MTCRELLQKFKEALERDELSLELLRKLVNKCGGSFGAEAFKAVVHKITQYSAAQAWGYFRGSVVASRDPAAAYGNAVNFIWRLVDWYELSCHFLTDFAVYVAKAVAKYRWPAKWPFVVPAAVAAEVNACELPDAVAEALGPDEFAKLEAFLEQGEAVVEIAPGLKVALVRDGRYVVMVV